jgi:putative isomerase
MGKRITKRNMHSQSSVWPFGKSWQTGCSRFAHLAIYCLLLLGALPFVARAESTIYAYTGGIRFDIRRVPFSRFGSYLSISDTSEFQPPFRQDGVFLRTMHDGGQRAFQFQLLRDGQPVPFETIATPALLTLKSGGGTVEICFDGPERIRFRGEGVELRLVSVNSWVLAYPQGRWEVTSSAMKYMLWAIHGQMRESQSAAADGSQNPALTFGGVQDSNRFEGELDAYLSAWRERANGESFDEAEAQDSQDYAAWLKKMPRVPASLGPGAELAAYVNWESVVDPNGNLKRPAMLMSKNWMTAIWSWDQTFNAMATSLSDPSLAWDQFLLPIDAQSTIGSFPDKWDADSVAWEFSKPPVHGWALTWMLRRGYFNDPAHLRQVYEPLVEWTNWYFTYRDTNKDGLPEYRHGNESGWDNSTVFRDGGLIESPDLSAFLVLQMETLAEIAKRLGRTEDATRWNARSEELLQKLLDKFWDGHEFVAFRVDNGQPVRSDSLLLQMPIVLGHRLPEDVRTQMIDRLRKRMSDSPFGLSTEPKSSPFYEADGYWRGPIWAASTMVIADGLDDMGEHDLADSLREKFCLMAQKSGMAENFDAQTGASLRDPAYTWTSSVYLIFADVLGLTQRGRKPFMGRSMGKSPTPPALPFLTP